MKTLKTLKTLNTIEIERNEQVKVSDLLTHKIVVKRTNDGKKIDAHRSKIKQLIKFGLISENDTISMQESTIRKTGEKYLFNLVEFTVYTAGLEMIKLEIMSDKVVLRNFLTGDTYCTSKWSELKEVLKSK